MDLELIPLIKGKGKKVKLSLCLTMQNTMKTYWGSGQLHAPAALPPGKELLVRIG
jgi:hypothetical protein